VPLRKDDTQIREAFQIFFELVFQVKLSRMRQRIAQRLKEAQNVNAMLTTFNEIDMRCVQTRDRTRAYCVCMFSFSCFVFFWRVAISSLFEPSTRMIS